MNRVPGLNLGRAVDPVFRRAGHVTEALDNLAAIPAQQREVALGALQLAFELDLETARMALAQAQDRAQPAAAREQALRNGIALARAALITVDGAGLVDSGGRAAIGQMIDNAEM